MGGDWAVDRASGQAGWQPAAQAEDGGKRKKKGTELGPVWQALLFQKQLRLWLLRWSGFSGGVGVVLENVWQNSFTC